MDWVLAHDEKYRYQLLNRLKFDCDYYLGYGDKHSGYLWAGNARDQIEAMKTLWNSFPDGGKPEWLTWKQIETYAEKMKDR
jgi:hypothetical protein